MYLPDLIMSVSDLQTARILAAAGVSYISFHQYIENLDEIKPWLEGPLIGVQIADPDQSLPTADFLIMPEEWYDLFSFSGRKIFWKGNSGLMSQEPEVITILNKAIENPVSDTGNFFHYTRTLGIKENILTWIDFEEDQALFEKLFL